MFLVCMAASVFFSFDSLFTVIFPADERQRAADVRAQTNVAGIVSDVADEARRKRSEERRDFFETSEWRDYSGSLERLATTLRAMPSNMDALIAEMEEKNKEEIAERRAQRLTQTQNVARAAARKSAAEKRRAQLDGQTQALEEDLRKINARIFELDKSLVTKQSEADAEEKGLGPTARAGRGPRYNVIVREVERLRAQKENLELQRAGFVERRKALAGTLETHGKAMVGIDKAFKAAERQRDKMLRVEDVSRRPIEVANAMRESSAGMLKTLTETRVAFEQEPTREALQELQKTCIATSDTLTTAPAGAGNADKSSCYAGRLHEVAAGLYRLNAGVAALGEQCTRPRGELARAGIDNQLTYGANCVQLSGLAARDAKGFRSSLARIDRNRDDKAHRFVVTANAFADGNRLAMLALGIAIAIDALVFMSGLFGATAVRSALSGLQSGSVKTARQREAVIESALLPNASASARRMLQAARPRYVRPGGDPAPSSAWDT